MAKIPTGLWSRGSKLVGMASKIAINEISTRVKNWDDEKSKIASKIELAQSIVKTMSEMKGASMKLGQLISMDLGDYLPPEVIKVLETLQQQSTFLPFEEIEAILKSELKERYQELKDISREPIAAASIGQVHSALLNNKRVVIKVQYPGVAESIPSDLKLLQLLFKNLAFFNGKEIDLKPFFEEVQEVLISETDYEHEASMLTKYREVFLESSYIIPELHPDFSTKKVLTMEWIDGKKFTDWIERSLLGERQKLAHELITLYLEEFFRHGLVQTDPNPGNFLMTNSNQMALLDFGAVKKYERDFIDGYRKVLMAALNQDTEKLILESEKIGFIDPRESQAVKDLYVKMMETLAAPFRHGEPFDFNDKKFYEDSRDQSWKLTRECRYSPPPKDLLFLHRKLGGVFFLIKKLNVKLTLKDYWHLVEIEN